MKRKRIAGTALLLAGALVLLLLSLSLLASCGEGKTGPGGDASAEASAPEQSAGERSDPEGSLPTEGSVPEGSSSEPNGEQTEGWRYPDELLPPEGSDVRLEQAASYPVTAEGLPWYVMDDGDWMPAPSLELGSFFYSDGKPVCYVVNNVLYDPSTGEKLLDMDALAEECGGSVAISCLYGGKLLLALTDGRVIEADLSTGEKTVCPAASEYLKGISPQEDFAPVPARFYEDGADHVLLLITQTRGELPGAGPAFTLAGEKREDGGWLLPDECAGTSWGSVAVEFPEQEEGYWYWTGQLPNGDVFARCYAHCSPGWTEGRDEGTVACEQYVQYDRNGKFLGSFYFEAFDRSYENMKTVPYGEAGEVQAKCGMRIADRAFSDLVSQRVEVSGEGEWFYVAGYADRVEVYRILPGKTNVNVASASEPYAE